MGHTLEQRRGDIRSYGNDYKIPIKLSNGELNQCAELGKYDVFTWVFTENNYLFRDTTKTFANGANYPANFLSTAGRAWIPDGSGGELPVRFAQPSDIPMLTRNARVAGTTLEPYFFLSDKKFHTRPNSVTIHCDVFLLPVPLVADSDTDAMPEWCEPDIARAGFEFALKMMVDQKTALELNEQELQRVERGIKRLYEEKFAFLNRNPAETE